MNDLIDINLLRTYSEAVADKLSEKADKDYVDAKISEMLDVIAEKITEITGT